MIRGGHFSAGDGAAPGRRSVGRNAFRKSEADLPPSVAVQEVVPAVRVTRRRGACGGALLSLEVTVARPGGPVGARVLPRPGRPVGGRLLPCAGGSVGRSLVSGPGGPVRGRLL